jgi:hypothetical protein
MRKLLPLVLVLLAVFSAQRSLAQLAAPDTSATVLFMRSTGYNGSAVAFTAFIDDQLVCRLNNKRFSSHTLAPGTHTFSVQFAGKSSKEKAERITINTEAGKTYYIQFVFQPGLLINNVYCQEVTESSANTILPKLKQDSKCL